MSDGPWLGTRNSALGHQVLLQNTSHYPRLWDTNLCFGTPFSGPKHEPRPLPWDTKLLWDTKLCSGTSNSAHKHEPRSLVLGHQTEESRNQSLGRAGSPRRKHKDVPWVGAGGGQRGPRSWTWISLTSKHRDRGAAPSQSWERAP